MPPPSPTTPSTSAAAQHSNRQWQVALSLLWAASHQGHNTDNGGANADNFATEALSGVGFGGLSAGAATRGDATGRIPSLAEFLRTVPDFYLLPLPQLAALTDFGMRRDYGVGEVALEMGAEALHVRVVLAGVVDVVDRQNGTVATMEACSTFGLDSVVVNERSSYRFVVSQKCSLLLLPAQEVLRVIHRSPTMRQSIGRKMSGQMSGFRALKEFSRLLFSHDAMRYEYLPLQSILESYTNIADSVVHTHKSSAHVDYTAWLYALRRLPENITRVFSLDLVRGLPPFLATRMRVLTRKAQKARLQESKANTGSPGASHHNLLAASGTMGDFGEPSREIRYVHTAQRRRCCWQLGIDGKNIVLMRDDFTDTLDFVLCLLIHMTESAKLRGKLQCLVSPSAIDVIEEEINKRNSDNNSVADASSYPSQQPALQLNDGSTTIAPGAPFTPMFAGSGNTVWEKRHAQAMMKLLETKLRMSPDAAAGCVEMWGEATLTRLHEVIMHREEYLLRADTSVARRFQSDPFHDWALGVRGAVVRRMFLDMHSPLPDNMRIDIVFGFTRTFLNCLSPCVRMYRDEIIAYGHKAHPEVMAQTFATDEDKLYALVPDFLTAHPNMQRIFNEHLEECGIEVLEDTALTGLQADIMCTDLLDPAIDRMLARTSSTRSRFYQHYQTTSDKRSNAQNNNNTSTSSNHQHHGAAGAGLAHHTLSSMHLNHAASNESFDINRGVHFLINVDYTFGQQAEGILKTLATVFGHRIRSINVCGKVAGFKGTRAGDIIVADNIVQSKMSMTSEDHLDEIRSINNSGIRLERVQEYLGSGLRGKSKVRRGNLITVGTAMLMNEPIINYYKNIWNCIGFEIEGAYFARMVKECKTNGLLISDLPTRHLYLVRELPEEENGATTFAREHHTGEVLTAQYAIARSILDLALHRQDEPQSPGCDPLTIDRSVMMTRAETAPLVGGKK